MGQLFMPQRRALGTGGGGVLSTRWGVFLREPQSNNNIMGIGEAKFRDGGGANITTGGTITSIGSLSFGPIGNLIDGSSSTVVNWPCCIVIQWNVKPAYITFVFAGAVNISQVALYNRSVTANQEITGFDIERSDNGGVDWVVQQTFTTPNTWRRSERRLFAVAGADTSTHWRFKLTAGDGNASMGELELFDAGVNITADATVTVNTTPSFGAAASITDKDGEPGFYYEFATPVLPTDLQITSRDDASFSQAPRQIDVRYWNGTKWIETDSYTGLTWTQNETKTFAITP